MTLDDGSVLLTSELTCPDGEQVRIGMPMEMVAARSVKRAGMESFCTGTSPG